MSSPTYVVATDLSQTSRHGARAATELALVTDGTVDLFCAIPSDVSDDMESFAHQVRTGLDGFASVYRKKGANVVVNSAVSKDPEEAILKHAHKVGAALVVVAPRGVTGAKRFLLGSMTERLVRSCPSRLLIARAAPKTDPKRIVIAVDGSPGCVRALRAGLVICEARHAVPVIVHVLRPPSSWVQVEEALSGTNSYKAEKARQKKARPRIEEWLERFDVKKLGGELHVREGNPVEEILAQARASNASLIVVGTQSKSRVQEFFVGSVARGVATHAKTSVLLARGNPPRPPTDAPKRAKSTKKPPKKRARKKATTKRTS